MTDTNVELTRRIRECTVYTKPDLSLDNLKLDEIPDLRDLWWVERLDLSDNNIKLIKREHLPNNLKTLFLSSNKIKNIKYTDFPEFIEVLNLMSNEICHFDGSQFKKLIKLNISVNCLETFDFPPNIIKLDISTNAIKELGEMPETLLKINCEDNLLEEIKYINNNLQYINISDNKFNELPNFTESIETIIAKNNTIEDLWYIPENVIVLNLENNRIKSFYDYTVEFPNSIKVINFNDNMLSEFEIEIPEGIEEIYLKSNRLEKLPNIPKSVKILDISDNCLNIIPKEIKDREIQLSYSNNLLEDSDSCNDSGYELEFLFGNKKNNKSNNILDYFPENNRSTIYSHNSSYDYPFISHNPVPPKKKYIYIEHKRRVVV